LDGFDPSVGVDCFTLTKALWLHEDVSDETEILESFAGDGTPFSRESLSAVDKTSTTGDTPSSPESLDWSYLDTILVSDCVVVIPVATKQFVGMRSELCLQNHNTTLTLTPTSSFVNNKRGRRPFIWDEVIVVSSDFAAAITLYNEDLNTVGTVMNSKVSPHYKALYQYMERTYSFDRFLLNVMSEEDNSSFYRSVVASICLRYFTAVDEYALLAVLRLFVQNSLWRKRFNPWTGSTTLITSCEEITYLEFFRISNSSVIKSYPYSVDSTQSEVNYNYLERESKMACFQDLNFFDYRAQVVKSYMDACLQECACESFNSIMSIQETGLLLGCTIQTTDVMTANQHHMYNNTNSSNYLIHICKDQYESHWYPCVRKDHFFKVNDCELPSNAHETCFNKLHQIYSDFNHIVSLPAVKVLQLEMFDRNSTGEFYSGDSHNKKQRTKIV
jgi:hypothetical protein